MSGADFLSPDTSNCKYDMIAYLVVMVDCNWQYIIRIWIHRIVAKPEKHEVFYTIYFCIYLTQKKKKDTFAFGFPT